MVDATSPDTSPRVAPLEAASAPPGAQALLAEARAQRGDLSGLLRLLAHSPAALGGYLGFNRELAGGVLPAALREQIAIAVAASNECAPCLEFHTRLGGLAGLSDLELSAARDGVSEDGKAADALRFARALLRDGGHISDAELLAVRAASFDDTAILEIVAVVFLNAFSNAVNGLGTVMSDLDHVSIDGAASQEAANDPSSRA